MRKEEWLNEQEEKESMLLCQIVKFIKTKLRLKALKE
jgi:hypothetical protein